MASAGIADALATSVRSRRPLPLWSWNLGPNSGPLLWVDLNPGRVVVERKRLCSERSTFGFPRHSERDNGSPLNLLN